MYNNLLRSLQYLEDVLHQRLSHHFSEANTSGPLELPGFDLEASDGPFTQFVAHGQLSIEEFILLLLALAPHLQASFFERIVGHYIPEGSDFPEFGGVRGSDYRYMMPTVETALFVLAGNDLSRKMELLSLFDGEHLFTKNKLLYAEEVRLGEPKNSARLILDPELIELFTLGRISTPVMSTQFPARRMDTGQDWEDLVLPESTMTQLREIEIWVRHNESVLYEWGMARKLKPGYRALFYGPPGTGKTLAASLIGKYTGREVFRVDLSKVISKYIGETEKNLANFFDKAEHKNWCIFFDEADACFGKRTGLKDAKDRYANQEVAYLLQRIEEYSGLVIMATNFKDNIDPAFIRRFNSIIYFPLPQATERIKIWQRAFPEQVRFEENVQFDKIAREYELSGSNIMNVVQYACLQARHNDTDVIAEGFIMDGLNKEYIKEGK